MKPTFTIFVPTSNLKEVLHYQKIFDDCPDYFIHWAGNKNIPKVYFEKIMGECVMMNVSQESFLNWAYFNNLKIS